MIRRLILGGVMLTLVVAFWFLHLMSAAGEFDELEAVPLEDCTSIEGIPGPEDITIDRIAGVALISSYDRRAAADGESEQGTIFAWSPQAGLRSLTEDFEGELRPLGISLFRDSSGQAWLFVINHTSAGHRVEIFSWVSEESAGGRLEHLESVADPAFLSPNDVAGVGPRAFYLTNDHGSASALGRAAEDYLRRKKAQVVYWDGERARVVAEGLGYANGIAVHPDLTEVFVASTTFGTVHHFWREVKSGELAPLESFDVGTGVDNIELDRHGKLWIGAHPKLLSFTRHASDPENLSPSQALWIDPERAFDPYIRTVWLDPTGEQLSGASVAAPWGDRLLIGQVFEPRVLVCRYG